MIPRPLAETIVYVMLLDIFLSLNTVSFRKGVALTEKLEIAKKYFQEKFLIDWVGIFPLILAVFVDFFQ